MKTLIIVAIAFISSTAAAIPFNLENVNFLNSFSRYGETQVTRYNSSQPYNQEYIRDFESSYAYGPNNAGTLYAGPGISELALDFNEVGMMWMDYNKNLWGLDFGTGNMQLLVDGSIIQSLENDEYGNKISGMLTYGSYTGDPNSNGDYTADMGSIFARENSTIASYVFKGTSLDPFINCDELVGCDSNITGMQYYDDTNDGQDNGNLYYLSEDSDGNILNDAIYFFNIQTRENGVWSSLSDLGITEENAPKYGMTFFNTEEVEIAGNTVSVDEPGAMALMATGATAVIVRKVGVEGVKTALHAICRKRGVCYLYDSIKKAIVGTAKIKK